MITTNDVTNFCTLMHDLKYLHDHFSQFFVRYLQFYIHLQSLAYFTVPKNEHGYDCLGDRPAFECTYEYNHYVLTFKWVDGENPHEFSIRRDLQLLFSFDTFCRDIKSLNISNVEDVRRILMTFQDKFLR